MSLQPKAASSGRIYGIGIVSVAAVAAALIWISSLWGVGTSPDSIQYLLNAKAVMQGASPLDISRHWPPFYPLALAGFGASTGDVLEGARLLHSALFGLNAVLLAWLVGGFGRDAGPLPFAATAMFVLAPASYALHHMAWSESLFLALLLLHFLAIRRSLGTSAPGWLIVAGLFVGAATLTRYAGVAFMASSALFLLFALPGGWRSRFTATCVYSVAALLQPVAWFAAVAIQADASAPRPIELHLIDAERVRALGSVFFGWFRQDRLGFLSTLIGLGLLAFALWHAVRSRATALRSLTGLMLWSGVFYVGFIFLSISLFDFYTPVDERIMSPLFLCVLGAIGTAGSSVSSRVERIGTQLATASLLVVMVAGVPALVDAARSNIRYGSGYFNLAFRQSPILGFLARIDGTRIYSNAAEAIEIHLGVKAQALPAFYDPVSARQVDSYNGLMRTVDDEVRQGQAIVVLFKAFAWRSYYPDATVFGDNLRLPVIYTADDGIIYGTARAPAKDLATDQ